MQVTETIKYVGVNDHDIDLFEGQYDVRENGMAYNSYVVIGEKVAVADTVDARFVDEWLGNVETALDGRTPDTLWCIIWSPTIRLALLRSWIAILTRRLLLRRWPSR